MPRILICSTPRVGSVSFAEKVSSLLQLPLAFQPWEPYAFNKQPHEVQETTLKSLETRDVVIHSHIHCCLDKIDTMDVVLYIGRRNRIKQAWSFFVAYHIGKMQNLNLNNLTVPEPKPEIVSLFIRWINLWDETSSGRHKVFYEDLDLRNDKWHQSIYTNIEIENFESIATRIKNECCSIVS